jgi:hypothetical protein
MLKVGAGKTQCATVPSKSDPGVPSKILPAFATRRLAGRDEDLQVLDACVPHCHLATSVLRHRAQRLRSTAA